MRCASYGTANGYLIENLFKYFKQKKLDPIYLDNILYVVIYQLQKPIHVYFFPFGCITIWGSNPISEKQLLKTLSAFEIGKLSHPTSDFIYFSYTNKTNKTFFKEELNTVFLANNSRYEKLSISYGLAQSVKLAVLEKSVTKILENSDPIHKELAYSGTISLSKKEISKKIGHLFSERYSMNLHSNILGTPQFFWRRPKYEPLYLMTTEFQDLNIRQQFLNHRLNMIQELYNILSNELNYRHSSMLETTIVILIAIELILAFTHSNSFYQLIKIFLG